MVVHAYAKINLSLDIQGKREDGYHLLDMIMQTVSLCDVLTLTENVEGIAVTCGKKGIPSGPENTVYRAAKAFYRYIGKAPGIQIAIDKQIPSQAGLAGGSADAAATLHALNQIEGARLSTKTLCEIGLAVGADVPFCVAGGTARVRGIGEEICPVASMPACWLVICKPPVNVPTKEAYARVDEHGGTGKNRYTARVLQEMEKGSLTGLGSVLGNAFVDLLPLPEVKAIEKQMLEQGATGSCMTGSGSAVYGLFAEKACAEVCAQYLLQTYPETFVCQPVNAYK